MRAALGNGLLERLASAATLCLAGNRLTGVDDLGKLPQLRLLDLSRNAINATPDLRGLVGLVALDLSHNALPSLSPALMPRALRFLQARLLFLDTALHREPQCTSQFDPGAHVTRAALPAGKASVLRLLNVRAAALHHKARRAGQPEPCADGPSSAQKQVPAGEAPLLCSPL